MIDFLIVGAGLSGISFSWELEKKNISYKVVDPCLQNSSSWLAGAIINPITGRKYDLQWNIHALLEKANQTYTEIGNSLHTHVLSETEIIKFHKSNIALQEFLARKNKSESFIKEHFEKEKYQQFFRCDFGGIIVQNVLQLNTKEIIEKYTSYLSEGNKLIKEQLHADEINITSDHIDYRNEQYKNVVFGDGIHCLQNRFFNWIPFKPAKGEFFIISIKDLPQDKVYHKGIILVPLGGTNFWCGATNTWNDLTTTPTAEGRKELEDQLQALLKTDYDVSEHKAAIRPTIKDRSPVVGSHPEIKNMYILNGMGTKGMSLAPFYADILLQHILTGYMIPKEANVLRFEHYFNAHRSYEE